MTYSIRRAILRAVKHHTKKIEYPPQIVEQLRQVERITDRLGMPVDDGIKLLVAALRAHGFTTDDSCEGHQSQRSNGPRVWITSGENEVLGRKLYDLDRESEESQSLSRTMQHNGYRVRASLLDLLDDFYDKRAVSEWVRIILEPRGIYGDCVLICQGTSTMDAIESDGQRLEWLKLAKQEFSDFTGFLVACFNPFSGDT